MVYLPWEETQLKKLHQLQLHQVGDLLRLPRASLTKRLGVAATRFLAALLGEIADPQLPMPEPETFEGALHFLDGVSHTEGL